MSDLKSEIVNKVLNQWENTAMYTSNKSVAEMTEKLTLGERIFNYVKAHPYSSVDEVERGLGVGKEASISSYLKAQMDKGILGREQKLRVPYPGLGSRYYFVYFHTSDTYNMPRKPMGRPKKAKQVVIKHKDVINERTPPRMKQVADGFNADGFNADAFIESLSVTQAKAVYLALKAIFDSRLHG